MSGQGAPTVAIDAGQVKGKRLAIVASSWHDEIMGGLIAGARRAAGEFGVEADLFMVPGSFELPLVCKRAAATYDAVVALGIVIRGGTPHFDYVCQGVTQGIMDVSLETGVPVGFGVLTTEDEDQGRARAGLEGSFEDKGYDSTIAALHVAATLDRLG